MNARWQATVEYRIDPVDGAEACVEVVHDLEEINDLHDLIERGPHWDAIIKIEIVRVNHITDADLTVEQAEKL
jgi:hypothetical protein